jgi:hypothetical protein
MDLETTLFLCAAFFAVATLYSAVGQAGATGYLAVMALGTVAPEVMRPTALALNVLVAGVTVFQFHRARFVPWMALRPFLAGSIPCAAIGGALSLPRGGYYAAVGVVLIVAAVILLWRGSVPRTNLEERVLRARPLPAILVGAGIGLLSGLTGIGGGIFLSPVLLTLGWAGLKSTAGASAPFNLFNSLIALATGTIATQSLPAGLPALALAAVAGALFGTWLGLEKLGQKGLSFVLALVMLIAGARLLIAS